MNLRKEIKKLNEKSKEKFNINESNYNKNYLSRIWIKLQFEIEINMKALNIVLSNYIKVKSEFHWKR